MKLLKIDIYGRAQGIGFRKKIKKFADKNNLRGFAENDLNGCVRVTAEGSTQKLNDFVEWLKSSPGFSFVRNLELVNLDDVKNYSGFKIKKTDCFFIDKFKGGFNLLKYFLGLQNPRNYLDKVPLHVAIIPDGNRRWARKRGLGRLKGHAKAAEFDSLFSLFNEARKSGVKYVSLWGFSTENWKRGKEEIDSLFKLFFKNLKDFRKIIHKDKIRFRHLGRKDRFPKKLSEELMKLEKESKNYSDFNVQFCLDYGGRDEIVRAINKILKSNVKKIDEKIFSDNLDSAEIPDPDLIIRTSWEKRISGFMPFQSVYSELAFVKKDFPAFKPEDLRKIIKNFGKRERRFGGDSQNK